MPYEFIEHTADVGIHVKTKDTETLFTEAALALFNQIIDASTLKGKEKFRLEVNGMDWPDLMVNWLRELLYFWNGKNLLVKYVEISELSDTRLAANVFVDKYDPENHAIISEIKAVTYHQIQVFQTQSGWEAKIIFDV